MKPLPGFMREMRIVPIWMPDFAAAATIIGTTGATYATYGLRISNLEARAERTEIDRVKRQDDYEMSRQRLAVEIQSLKDVQLQQGRTLARIADRLGVLP